MIRITCKKAESVQPSVPAGQMVNKVGKYLYNHIDGALRFKKGPNSFDIWFILYYQIPYLQRIPGRGREYNSLHEMTININITTYQNKIRINTIECDDNEMTLGYDLWKPEQLQNLDEMRDPILQKIIKHVEKKYQDYDFVF